MARSPRDLAEVAARFALGAVFLCAGALKALDPAAFAAAVDRYRLLPFPAAAALALYLPWLEIACGAGVFWARTRLGALNLLLGMCVMFSAALASAWWRNLDITCGCFGLGVGGHATLLASLVRSLALGLAGALLLGRELRPVSAPGGRAA